MLTWQYLHYHAHRIFWLSKVSGCNQICIRRICSDQPQRSVVSQIDKQARLGSQRIFPRRSDPKDLWENIRGSGFTLSCIVLCALHYIVLQPVGTLALQYFTLCCAVLWCVVVLCCLVLGCCSSGFRLFCIVFHCVLLRHKLGFTLSYTVSPWGVRLPEKQLLLFRVVLKFSFYTLNVTRQKEKKLRF